MRQSGDAITLGEMRDRQQIESSDAPVLFLLPGIGGEDRLLKPFHHMKNVALVHYVDWPQLVAPGWQFGNIVSLVKRQIEERVPSGPICLAGYSMGGPLGYACALAFQAEGRQVQCLAILDGPANLHSLKKQLRTRLRARLLKLRSFRMRAGLASFFAKVLVKDRARPLLQSGARYRGIKLPFGFDYHLHRKLRMQMLMQQFRPWWATINPSARALTSPTYIFRSEEHEPYEREDLGWGDYCSNLKVIYIPGSHHSMLDPENYEPLTIELMKVMGLPWPA